MKKGMMTAVCAIVLSLGIASVQAQQKNMMPRGPMLQSQEGNVFDYLNLTNEQKEAHEKIKAATQEKIVEIRKEMKVYLDKIEDIRAEERVEFEKILTPEQKDIFDQYLAEIEARKAERKARNDEMRKQYEARKAAKK